MEQCQIFCARSDSYDNFSIRLKVHQGSGSQGRLWNAKVFQFTAVTKVAKMKWNRVNGKAVGTFFRTRVQDREKESEN